MLSRLLYASGTALVALGLLVSIWVALHNQDAPFVDESNLTPEWKNLAPGEDGFGELELAAAAVAWPNEDPIPARLKPGPAWDASGAEELITHNEAALVHLERVLAAPGLELPMDVLDGEQPTFISAWQSLGEVLRLRAYLKLEQGETVGAFEDALNVMRFGHRLESANGTTLVSVVVALQLKHMGLEAIREFTRSEVLSADAAGRFVERLENLRPDSGAWQRMWAAEYQYLRTHALNELKPKATTASQGPWGLRSLIPETYLYQHNRTVNGFADLYRKFQRESSMQCSQLEPPAAPAPKSGARTLKLLAAPNMVGKILLEVGTPNFHGFQLKRCQIDTQISTIQALLALKAQRNQPSLQLQFSL